MGELAAGVSAALASENHERALALLVTAWQRTPSLAIAAAVDVVDARADAPPFDGATAAWIKAAKASTQHVERGPLLRAIAGRTGEDTLRCLAIAKAWRDPRLTHVLHGLLTALPWAGRRSVSTWRPIFELLAAHGDPRTLELAATLPGTWKVGVLQGWLTNRMAETVAQIAAVPEHPETAALATLGAPPARAKAAAPAATEADLLAAIYAAPDDDAPRLVYADWLQERGDERGELIALQLRADRDAAARKRERALLKANAKRWLGPLAATLKGDVEFRRGFPAKAEISWRHQRDVEQHAAHAAWATLEELTWRSAGVPRDQVPWSRFIHPAMHGLRIARDPWPENLLAAPRPWRIRRLELAAKGLGRDGLHAIFTSPLLPELAELWAYGTPMEPDWLRGVTRVPPTFEINKSLDDDTLATWLDTVAALPIETFTLHGYPRYLAHFTRERAGGPFTRLDVEVEMFGRDKLDPLPRYIQDLSEDVAALPAKSLSHFAATTVIGGERVAVAAVERVGRKKLS